MHKSYYCELDDVYSGLSVIYGPMREIPWVGGLSRWGADWMTLQQCGMFELRVGPSLRPDDPNELDDGCDTIGVSHVI